MSALPLFWSSKNACVKLHRYARDILVTVKKKCDKQHLHNAIVLSVLSSSCSWDFSLISLSFAFNQDLRPSSFPILMISSIERSMSALREVSGSFNFNCSFLTCLSTDKMMGILDRRGEKVIEYRALSVRQCNGEKGEMGDDDERRLYASSQRSSLLLCLFLLFVTV